MAGAIITGSETALGGPWTGKGFTSCWWNSYQSRWDGAVPKDEGEATGDNYVVKDITGTIAFTAIQLDDRGTSRICTFWDDAGKTLYAVGFHTTGSEYWEIAYNSGTDAYSYSVGADGAGEAVTGITRENADDSASLYVYPNGDVWVAVLNNAGLQLNRRTSGSWNGTTVNLDTGLDLGTATLNHFVDSGTTYIYVFSTEDSSVTDSEWNAYYIDQDAAAPMTAGNWTEDTIAAQTEFSVDADNHISSVRDNATETIYIVLKLDSAIGSDTEIGLLKRTSGGTYTSHEIEDQDGAVTRPAIALDSTNSKLYVAMHDEAADAKVVYVTADLSDLDTWSARTDLFSLASNDFNNPRPPQQNFNATSVEDMLFVAELNATNVYWSLVTIPAVGVKR